MAETVYDADFYAAQGDESFASARAVLPRIIATLHPTRIVDIGCGIGTWLAAARAAGITDCLGVDGDYVDHAALRIPPDQFLPDDLAKPGLSDRIAARHPERFDVALCLEVAEHLPEARAASFITELCALADVVVFSAALPFQFGTDHINEQWPEYWAILFRANGFRCFDPWRDDLWNQPHIAWWYAQNLLVFAREGSRAAATLPHPADAAPLARVHPLCWLSGTLNLWRPYRAAARDEEPADYRAVRQAWHEGATALPDLAALARARAHPDAADRFPFTRTLVADPEASLATAEASLASALAERDHLTEERATLRAEIAARTRHCAEITAARDHLTEECATQRAEIAARTRHCAEITAARDQLAEECAMLRAEIAAQTHQCAEITAARDQLAEERATLRAEIAQATAARQILEAANATLRQQVLGQEAALAHLSREARTASAACAERDALRQELEAAGHHLAAMRNSTSWRLTRPLRRLRGWRDPP